MPSLRVALVASAYNHIRDGVALTLNRLVEYLERNGVEVLVFTPGTDKPAFVHQGTIVPVRSVPLPMRPEYRLALGLTRASQQRMREFAPDLVHVTTPDYLGYRAMKFGQTLKVPVVASFHARFDTYAGYYGFQALSGAVDSYLRSFYGQCRELYVPSESMAEVLAAKRFTTPIRIWARGVDSNHFNPDKRSKEWRAKHGIKADEFVVAFVSRLVREKQLDTLAKIFHALEHRGVPHRSLIVGEGPDGKALKRQLPRGIFTEKLHGEELAHAYACADVFLFPSDSETFGNVTLEAMASGLPTICADATGSRSLVADGVTGFLAKTGDVEGFADRIANLAGDPDLRRRMAAAARARSLAFNWDEVMGRLLGYYREVAGRSPSA
jgi:glycosyltransferase involved in cell wall biosynthesis